MQTISRLAGGCASICLLLMQNACTVPRDYAGVDPRVLAECEEEATDIKALARLRDDGPLVDDAITRSSAQKAYEDARDARDFISDESQWSSLSGWPKQTLIDRCLLRFAQPVPEDAVAELRRWEKRDASSD